MYTETVHDAHAARSASTERALKSARTAARRRDDVGAARAERADELEGVRVEPVAREAV